MSPNEGTDNAAGSAAEPQTRKKRLLLPLNAREQMLLKVLVGLVILVCILLASKWRFMGGA
jgi:hypothetical protein